MQLELRNATYITSFTIILLITDMTFSLSALAIYVTSGYQASTQVLPTCQISHDFNYMIHILKKNKKIKNASKIMQIWQHIWHISLEPLIDHIKNSFSSYCKKK
jgi:uncharacterized membrane protein